MWAKWATRYAQFTVQISTVIQQSDSPVASQQPPCHSLVMGPGSGLSRIGNSSAWMAPILSTHYWDTYNECQWSPGAENDGPSECGLQSSHLHSWLCRSLPNISQRLTWFTTLTWIAGCWRWRVGSQEAGYCLAGPSNNCCHNNNIVYTQPLRSSVWFPYANLHCWFITASLSDLNHFGSSP